MKMNYNASLLLLILLTVFAATGLAANRAPTNRTPTITAPFCRAAFLSLRFHVHFISESTNSSLEVCRGPIFGNRGPPGPPRQPEDDDMEFPSGYTQPGYTEYYGCKITTGPDYNSHQIGVVEGTLTVTSRGGYAHLSDSFRFSDGFYFNCQGSFRPQAAVNTLPVVGGIGYAQVGGQLIAYLVESSGRNQVFWCEVQLYLTPRNCL